MSESKKGFNWLSKSYYFKPTIDEADGFYIGLYYDEGGCDYEFSVEYKVLGDLCCCVRVYNDAFKAFEGFKEFFEAIELRSNVKTSPDDLYEILIGLGYKDFTRRVNPAEQLKAEKQAALSKLTEREKQILGIS